MWHWTYIFNLVFYPDRLSVLDETLFSLSFKFKSYAVLPWWHRKWDRGENETTLAFKIVIHLGPKSTFESAHPGWIHSRSYSRPNSSLSLSAAPRLSLYTLSLLRPVNLESRFRPQNLAFSRFLRSHLAIVREASVYVFVHYTSICVLRETVNFSIALLG